jgi:hypothetical protein
MDLCNFVKKKVTFKKRSTSNTMNTALSLKNANTQLYIIGSIKRESSPFTAKSTIGSYFCLQSGKGGKIQTATLGK